jgi:hypothetical protein
MRDFSDSEKAILKTINEETQNSSSVSFLAIWNKIFSDISLHITTETIGSARVEVVSISSSIANTTQNVQQRITELISLLSLFKEKGYLLFSQIHDDSNIVIGDYKAPVENLKDVGISKSIIEFYKKAIITNPEFKRFVEKDDFRARDEVRFNKTFNRSTTALYVSSAALFIAILFNLINLSRSNSREQKMDTMQYETLLYHLDGNCSLRNNRMVIDTIKR